MNRYKCPACGRNQYTSCDTAEGCIYCGHQGELEKMPEHEGWKTKLIDGGCKHFCPECQESEVEHDA